MGLRKKTSLWFAAILVALTLGGYVGLSMTLRPAFDALEDLSSRQDLARVRNGITATLAVLNNVSIDWGQWDETYAFIGGTNPMFDDINVEPASLTALGINLMAIYDMDGALHAGMYVDLESSDTLPVNEAILSNDLLGSLQQHDNEASELNGIVESGFGPMLFYSRPVTHSDGSGPMRGTFIVGRMLSDSMIAEIGDAAEVAVEPVLVGTDSRSVNASGIFGAIEQITTDDSRINEQLLHDIDGNPVIALRVASPRDVSRLGRNTTASVLLMFAGLGALAALGMEFILSNTIIKPLDRLRATMADVGNNEDSGLRIALQRDDEIGDLANSFDEMLDSLDSMKRQNIDQSFKAGMAEVAAGVLHNIRNTLMPVVNNVAIARDTLSQEKNVHLAAAVDELASSDTPADRRVKLAQFVEGCQDQAAEARTMSVECLDQALEQLDHTTDILMEQERYTHAKPVIERVNVAELIEGATQLLQENGASKLEVNVQEGVADLVVRAHRVGLMQVFGNLFVNAAEAIARSGRSAGRIRVTASHQPDGPESDLELTISDNGAGIDSAAMEHLFDRGYSTKEGSGGLGLHWSANAIASMGGEISASSDGAGRGAEFHIKLKAA